MFRAFYTSLALSCLCLTVYAEDGFSFNKLVGVEEIDADHLDTMSCRDLYMAATMLEPNTQNYRSSLLNENTDIVISTISLIYKPAIYAYSITIPWHFKEDYRLEKTNHSLDSVRRRMSSLNCFQK